jgi:CHAT domain-containing protein
LQGEGISTSQIETLGKSNPDTLFVAWGFPEEGEAFALTLSTEGARFVPLSLSLKEARGHMERWRESLLERRIAKMKEATTTETALAKTLYQKLIAPLERAGALNTSHHRLVFVATNPLLDLPFAALLDAQGRRLLERYAVRSVVSLGALLWEPNLHRPTRSLLCVCDPTGDGKKPQNVALRGDFAPLPWSREEGQTVAKCFSSPALLVGTKAREAEVKRLMGECAVLHFATHGDLDSVNGLASGLILAMEPAGSAEDGVLEAREIADMSLSARLAVLSACETGRGQASGGEGILGLVWAFRAGGCPSVIASQWKVDDAATGSLMGRFYGAVQSGKRLDDALRSAALAVQKDPRWSRPRYWAAFQLIGEAQPL